MYNGSLQYYCLYAVVKLLYVHSDVSLGNPYVILRGTRD